MSSTTTTRLRALDAADHTIDPVLRARLDERVRAIPSSLPDVANPSQPVRASRRPTRRRLALLAGGAAVVTAGSIVLPGLGGGDAAYASWSATPTTVSAGDLAAVVADCRGHLTGVSPPWDDSPMRDLGVGDVAIAERRGDYVALLLRPRGDADVSAFCVATIPTGSGDASDVRTGMAGSSGPAAVAGPAEFLEGSMAQFGGDRPAAFVDGVAGSDVVGVRIHDSAGYVVDATVTKGRYAAWWPGSIIGDGSARDAGGNGGPAPQLRYDVRLRDGTVIEDADPARPRWPTS